MPWIKALFVSTLLSLLLFAAGVSSAQAALADDWQMPKVLSHTLILQTEPSTVSLFVAGQHWRLLLEPNTALLSSAQTSASQADLFKGVAVYRGSLAGRADSWVRISRFDDQWFGAVFDGDRLFSIEAVSDGYDVKRGSDGEVLHAVYALERDLWQSVVDSGGVVVPEHARGPDRKSAHYNPVSPQHWKSAQFAVPITIVTDESFNARHGSNTAAVVASRLNFLDGIYSEQLGVGVTLWHLKMLSDNATLTTGDASQLLPDFRTYMTVGVGSSLPFQGLSHLFTDRSFSNNVLGTAYIDVLCNSRYGYGWNKNRRSNTGSALVVAHEMGHNLAALHDNSESCPDGTLAGIMNSRLNGSEQFSDCSLDAMAPVLANAACLVTNPSFDGVFLDRFEAF
jgi:hypothetical protein